MTVLLGIPTHGSSVAWRTALAVGMCTEHELQVSYLQMSLLPHVFNLLWVAAVKQPDITHFAMLHADIGVQDGLWLDKMIAELERTDALILSANVRMKDATGKYSTAWDNGKARPDLKLEKLHRDDLEALPTTFNVNDVRERHPEAERLLLNTGCWVAKLDGDWIKKVCFRLKTHVTWDGNVPTCDVDSEDWELSRDMASWGFGERIYATSIVTTEHVGSSLFV